MATGMVLPMAILAFCTWAVYMGALASMQAACPDEITTLTGGTAECKTVYRYWWFIMSYEFVIVVGVAVVALMNKLHNLKVAFVGLFAVGLMLYINASNEFLTREDMGYFKDGPQLHRIRTITAGSIMTATANAFVIIALGLTEDAHVAEVIVEKPAASAV